MQNWIREMAGHLKSIDTNHLLEIGLEGFYGNDKKQYNPNYINYGTDFISNNQIREIDFTTIHIYPDQWYIISNPLFILYTILHPLIIIL